MRVRTTDPSAPGTLEQRRILAGSIVLGLLSLLGAWWALFNGAYFSGTFLPGVALIVVLAGLVAALMPLPPRGRWLWGLVALIALGFWALASALWSPVPDTAVRDAQMHFAYAAAFGLGVWSCAALGRMRALALAPLVVAAGLTSVVTVVALLAGADASRFLDEELTLEFPIGYRNANAAFLLCGVLAALALAGSRILPPRARPLPAAAATLILCLAVLCQSRGSMLAIVFGLGAYVAFSPARRESLAGLAITVLPVVAALPVLLSVYGAADPDIALRSAALASLLAAAGSGLLAALRPRIAAQPALERARRRMPSPSLPSFPKLATGLAVVLAGLVVAVGPGTVGDEIEERISGFGGGGTPNFTDRGSRFSFDPGSNRQDFWRVAAIEATRQPVLGTGSGGFQYAYLEERSKLYTPADPHSVQMLFVSELGLPGLAGFALLIWAVATATVRSRRVGGGAAWLAAGTAGVGAYWFAHASIDWLWGYPGVTLLVIVLAGAVGAPAALTRKGRPTARAAGVLAPVVVAASCVPAYLAWHWTESGAEGWRTDPGGAYRDLDRAQRINPLAHRALLVEGTIARERGEIDRARRAFTDATRRVPQDWSGHYMLGRLLLERDPAAARAALAAAEQRFPGSRTIEATHRAARRQAQERG